MRSAVDSCSRFLNATKELNKPLKNTKDMKRILRCLCLVFMLMLSCQVFSQNYSTPRPYYVPAQATLVGDGFEMTQPCQVYFDVDTLYNCADFQVLCHGEQTDMVHFSISYLSDSGTVLHMDKNAVCVMEDTQVGKACKLTIKSPNEDWEKIVFLFYLLE